MTPSDIVLEDVSKHYETPKGPVVALAGVTLRIGPGASLGVVGPSGCGKSTLLALVAGLELPDSGRIVVEGRVVSSLTEAERACLRRERFGVVFQRDNLLPFLTAVENVALQLALRNEREGFDRCHEMLARLGVADVADKLPDQLSGGQRQRVAVARALVGRPAVIIADEPTGSLDDANSEAVFELLRSARDRDGTTLVVATHDLDLAARLDAVVQLRDGSIAYSGRISRPKLDPPAGSPGQARIDAP
jgi:putative ABC transport system ATP-binding protein